MRSRLVAGLLALFLASPAYADVQPTPYVLNLITRCSGAITSGGVSQTAISAATNAGSKFWFIQNPPLATEPLYIDVGEAAGPTSMALTAGASLTLGGPAVWQGQVTVYAATTSHAFTCFYGQ